MTSLGGGGAAASSTMGTNEDTIDNSPFWKYVSGVEKGYDTGGNRKWTCNYCGNQYKGSHTRVRAHLLKIEKRGIALCNGVTLDDIKEMKKVEEEMRKRKANAAPNTVPLPISNSNIPPAPPVHQASTKRRKGGPANAIEKAFDMQNRNILDALIARLFYTSALPFNVARSPLYEESYSFAANHNLSGYVPPGYNKLRTTLLLQEKANVERLLEPIKSKWDEKGVTIVSDGWSDPQRRPLINFMVVSDGGPMFMKSIDCSGEVKDKHFIAARLEEVINMVGDSKVVQIITDNAANCKAAGEIIEGKFLGIYWTPCVVHTLNLAMKNICAPKNLESNQEAYRELNWITDVHDEVLFVKNFLMNHQMRLAIFNRFSPLKLLTVADTRFASNVVMLKRFLLIRRSLEAMVLSEEWKQYKDDNVPAAEGIRGWVLSERWWNRIIYIIDFTGPIYNMIRVCDTDKPSLHLVYEMWDSMIENVKKVIYEHDGLLEDDESSFYGVIYDILVARWAKNNTPLHCLAHSLNPRFYTKKWLEEGEGRVSPNKDLEVCHERNKCFKRLFHGEDYKVATNDYAKFIQCVDHFNNSDAIEAMSYLEPRNWWAVYGSASPLLQTLALKVLGQPSSSSCCERNWSTYAFIHSLKRNKLTPQRAEHLVFVHNNLRLLSRNSSEYQTGKAKMWDVGGDNCESMEEAGFLELANLTLDEPELEAFFCEDVGDDVEI